MTLPALFEDVKLVIWDLDETLWTGVLSEGQVDRCPFREGVVRALAYAGIVNSVASNNDRSPAEAALRQLGLWDLLVFPQFSWGSKVEMVREVVRLTRLRASQVLLVDDSRRIREEVRSACGVATASPDEVDSTDPKKIPVSDPALSRLGHYKVIEAREQAQRTAPVRSTEEFLRSCEMRVGCHEPRAWKDRILELARRANQLNFTRTGLTEADFERLVADPSIEFRAVSASDKFGSYGISGFYALSQNSQSLIHFVFSCRLLNMGVEEFVFQRLGRPHLSADSTKMARLANAPIVDWITGDDEPPAHPEPAADPHAINALFVGGCELETMATYISSDRKIRATWHLPDMVDGVQCFAHSSLLVLGAVCEGHGEHLNVIPWLRNWRPPAPLNSFDLIVLSLWVDYSTTCYRNRENGFLIPSFRHFDDETSPDEWSYWWGQESTEELARYDPVNELTPVEIADRLMAFQQVLPRTCRLVVLNCAEAQPADGGATRPWQHRRNRAVNRELDRLEAQGHIELVDVRRVVTGPEDFADDGIFTHYSRSAYAALAATIRYAARTERR